MKIQFVDKNFRKLWQPIEEDTYFALVQDETTEHRVSARVELHKLDESPSFVALKIGGLVLLESGALGKIGSWVDLDSMVIMPTNRSLIIQYSLLSDDAAYEFGDRVLIESHIRQKAIVAARTMHEIQVRLEKEEIDGLEAFFWRQWEEGGYIGRCLGLSPWANIPSVFPEVLTEILQEEFKGLEKRRFEPSSQCYGCDYHVLMGATRICNAFYTPSYDVVNCPDYIPLDSDRRNIIQSSCQPSPPLPS